MATGAVTFPSTDGITADPHQGGLPCLLTRLTVHHLLVGPLHLSRLLLQHFPTTDMLRRHAAGTGRLPGKRTRFDS